MEGAASFITSWFGGCVTQSTYSGNIGVIGSTKVTLQLSAKIRRIRILVHFQVASRLVIVCSAIILIFLGLFSKFGAVLATIPEPIIGAVFLICMAMVGGMGLSNIQVNSVVARLFLLP